MANKNLDVYGKVYDTFSNLENDSVEYFITALTDALADTTYSREDMLYDIRGGLLFYTDIFDQDHCENQKDRNQAIEISKTKAKICKQLGLDKPLIVMLLTDFANVWPNKARLMVEHNYPTAVSSLIDYFRPLAMDKHDKVFTHAFALGFVEDEDLQVIKDANLSQTALKCLYKLTQRTDLRGLLGNDYKREMANSDFGL